MTALPAASNHSNAIVPIPHRYWPLQLDIQHWRRHHRLTRLATTILLFQVLVLLLPNVTALLSPPSMLYSNHRASLLSQPENNRRDVAYCLRGGGGVNKGQCYSLSRHLPLSKVQKARLWALSDDGENNDPNNNDASKKSKTKYSVARAGGRNTKTNTQRNDVTRNVKPDNNGLVLATLSQWAIPFLVIAVVLRILLGDILFGGAQNSNVVYYSKSVYQSTPYSRDGNVETTRKESFQSNIPGLVERSKDATTSTTTQQQYGSNGEGTRFYSSDLDFDDELRDLEDEIDSLMFRGW